MLKNRKSNLLLGALLLIPSAIHASGVKKEKLIPDTELNNLIREIETNYKELLHPGINLFFAWLTVSISGEIDPVEISISSYLYSLNRSYNRCIKDQLHPKEISHEEFKNHYKNYATIRDQLLQSSVVPLSIKTQINRMDRALDDQQR